MKEVYAKLDEKNKKYTKKFPESDGIVRKSYCRSCGKLRSGTGAYGWYDVDNLPGNCTGNHSDGSSSSETTSASNGNNSNTTKSSADKTTQAQTQAPQTEAPTEAPATETPAQ